MYKPALRAAPRCLLRNRPARRFLSIAPPAQRRRGWANSAVRWGLAVGAVYVYSTSSVFAEEPESIRRIDDSIHAVQESNQPTVDAIVEEKRLREIQQAAGEQEKERLAKAALAADGEAPSEEGKEGIDGLADEAGSEGAFNPETGEINWDCPCLGGMAHGPCGEEFRAAFSCFVYSNEEPKGVECIEKFKGMQDCFRLHPEMYGSELEDDEDEIEAELLARENTSSDKTEGTASTTSAAQLTTPPNEPESAEQATISRESPSEKQHQTLSIAQGDNTQASGDTPADKDKEGDKDDELIPKAAHDASKN